MSVFTLGNYTVHLGTDLLGFQLPEGLKIISSRTLQNFTYLSYITLTQTAVILSMVATHLTLFNTIEFSLK